MIGKGTGIMTAVSFKSLCLGGVNDVRALHGADRRQGNHLSGRQEPLWAMGLQVWAVICQVCPTLPTQQAATRRFRVGTA